MVILAVAILLRDARPRVYVSPLSIAELAVSTYQPPVLRLIPETIQRCTLGASCTERQLELFGFITIPLLSLTAFTIISLSMVFAEWRSTDDS